MFLRFSCILWSYPAILLHLSPTRPTSYILSPIKICIFILIIHQAKGLVHVYSCVWVHSETHTLKENWLSFPRGHQLSLAPQLRMGRFMIPFLLLCWDLDCLDLRQFLGISSEFSTFQSLASYNQNHSQFFPLVNTHYWLWMRRHYFMVQKITHCTIYKTKDTKAKSAQLDYTWYKKNTFIANKCNYTSVALLRLMLAMNVSYKLEKHSHYLSSST